MYHTTQHTYNQTHTGDFRLDKYYEGVQCSVDGVMHEQDVEEMLAEIHEEYELLLSWRYREAGPTLDFPILSFKKSLLDTIVTTSAIRHAAQLVNGFLHPLDIVVACAGAARVQEKGSGEKFSLKTLDSLAALQGLLDALLELRKRRLREQPTRTHNGEKYGLLPSSGS
eukprot:1161615-Pelagomonas_calceolata.AAC.16